MKINEIKLGMVFKENDKRFDRWIRITWRTDEVIEFDSSTVSCDGPFDLVRRKSKHPERFHAAGSGHKGNGYTLVPETNKYSIGAEQAAGTPNPSPAGSTPDAGATSKGST